MCIYYMLYTIYYIIYTIYYILYTIDYTLMPMLVPGHHTHLLLTVLSGGLTV